MLENDDKDENLPTAIAGTSIGSGTPHLDLQFRSGIPLSAGRRIRRIRRTVGLRLTIDCIFRSHVVFIHREFS